MLPAKIAFVDLETSGSSATSDRIIEIGIVRVVNNRVVKKFQTLIDPQTHLSEFISGMTGIRPEDLRNAPTFRLVQDEVAELLKDAVFVAHNVRFDYSFMRQEFRRLGIKFSAKQFCTVKLFRALHPELRHHNLDSLIAYYGLSCNHRHRAFDDAHVLWQFYERALNIYSPEILAGHINLFLKKPTLPQQLPAKTLKSLPEDPGVYIFYGENGAPLYVGKSVNIRDRVLAHFAADTESAKEMAIAKTITSLETFRTDSELEALILESQLVKEKRPLYNHQLRPRAEFTLIKQITESKYMTPYLETVNEINQTDLENIIAICKSKADAKRMIENITKDYELCPKLMGLQKSSGGCFDQQIGKCAGACIGHENPGIYNVRFLEAFAKAKIMLWPFKTPIVIYKKIVVDRWCLQGQSFDPDTYRILKKFILDNRNQKYITPFLSAESRSKSLSLSSQLEF